MPLKKSYPANKKIIYNNVIKDSSRLFTCIGGAQMGHRIRDGDLYKIAVIADKSFTIRYGYSTESEREKWEPTPIYPDLSKKIEPHRSNPL